MNEGQWHHAIVEADRRAKTLTVYVDGRRDTSADGVDGSVSLANDGDVYVGGTPEGRHLDGTLDFLRIAYGTLGDRTRGLSRRLIETFFCLPIGNRMQAEGGQVV